jgi:hypothetical protein
MKRIVSTIIILALASSVLSGGFDSITRKLMKRGGMTKGQIEQALALPQVLVVDEENALILPRTFVYTTPSGEKSFLFHIEDTIVGKVLYDLTKREK